MGSLDESEKIAKRVKKIRDNVKRCQDHLGVWRSMAMDSFAMYGNDQWDGDDMLAMEKMKKAPITFNRITRTISAVMGIEATNRQAVMYYPREVGDSGVSELLTGAANWVRESCDAEDEESQAFRDLLICGLGWTETMLDYEQNREGNILVERRDPLEMGYDINARKDNMADSKFFFRFNKLTKEELIERFPDKAEDIISDPIFNDTQMPHDATKENAYKNDSNQDGTKNDKRDYHVVQYQDYYKKPYWLAFDQMGNFVELDKYDKETDTQYHRAVKLKKRVYVQTFIIGDKFLEEHELPVNDFTFKPMTGLYNRRRNLWFGLVELMKDPQMWSNKWMTEVLYILRTNASGGLMYEPGAFVNPQQAMEDWAKPNSKIALTPGGAAKISPKVGQGGYPDGLMNLLGFAIGAIQDVTGVNVEMLGMTDRNQPIGLEKQRKEAGTGILSPFFNALRRYHKEQGRILAELIIEYISDGRLVRIAGKEGAEYVPLLKDNLTFKYDIIVDEAVTNPDIKQRVFELLAPIIPTLMQAGIPVPKEVLDYFPIPSGLSEAWKKELAPPEPTPEEIAAQQEQEMDAKIKDELLFEQQMQLMKGETVNLYSKAGLNYSKSISERAKAANTQAETFGKVSGIDEEREQEEFMREQARKDLSAVIQARREILKNRLKYG